MRDRLRRAVERGGPETVHRELMELHGDEGTIDTDDLP